MAKLFRLTIILVMAGCATNSPEKVFRESLCAFAEGEIEHGARFFSKRLLAERPVNSLQSYYRKPEKCQAIAFLLKDYQFRLIKIEPKYAIGEVTWNTGRAEPVYFVREKGDWKLDLPPRRH